MFGVGKFRFSVDPVLRSFSVCVCVCVCDADADVTHKINK